MTINQDTTKPNPARALLEGSTSRRNQQSTERSLMTSLVNRDLSYFQILEQFMNNPDLVKFHELREASSKKALTYHKHLYNEAVDFTANNDSPGRKAAIQAMAWAHSNPWPGKTGSTDRAVYLAHVEIAYRAGRMTYAASSRELAERSGTTRATATKATKRLDKKRLIQIINSGDRVNAVVYRLRKNIQSDPHPIEREWGNLYAFDAFRFMGLGRSAAAVWECLREHGPRSPKELAQRTGRSVETVRRVLKRMARLVNLATNQPIPMVMREGKLWRALDVDLDEVAMVVGTDGDGEKQRTRHQMERADHRYWIEWLRSREN
jgi:DNA-binding MarR family transcriptional regulator